MAPNHCQSSTYINAPDIPQTRKNTAPDNPEFLLMMNIKINIGAPIRDPKGTNPADVPKSTAMPVFPLNLKNTGKNCPSKVQIIVAAIQINSTFIKASGSVKETPFNTSRMKTAIPYL